MIRCASPTCGKPIERVLIRGERSYFRNMGDRDETIQTDVFGACSWACLISCATALKDTEAEHDDDGF